jgi:hypothetical protein
MGQPSAHPSLYTPESAEGVAPAINFVAEVGGGRTAGEASPLMWCGLLKRCLVASTGATEKAHRAKVAARRPR